MERVKPTASLILSFRDEVGGNLRVRFFAELRERHRAAFEPTIEDFRDSSHFRVAFFAIDFDRVDKMFVEVVDFFAAQFFELGFRRDAFQFAAFFAFPNREGRAPKSVSRDRWILSELNILIREMTDSLENYEIQKAVAPLEKFLDGLTNWYVRRSRRRFWKSESDDDKNAAYATLFEVLKTVAKLLAPITPFLAEKIWQNLTNDESVHLENWPEVDKGRIDEELGEEFKIAREVISTGLKLRASKNIKIRKPLNKVQVGLPITDYGKDLSDFMQRQEDVIKEELNVKEVEYVQMTKLGEWEIKLNFKTAGKKLGTKVPEIQKALAAGNWKREGENIKVLDELLSREEYDPQIKPKANLNKDIVMGSAAKNIIVVALNTKITPELALEGHARDLVRAIQDLRKTADFEVSDRIELQLENADEILAKFEKYISAEVLAKKVIRKIENPAATSELDEIKIGVKKL